MATTVTDISTARRKRAPGLGQRVRIRVSPPCRLQHLHLPYFSVCPLCWLTPRDPYNGKEGAVSEYWLDSTRGKVVFEIRFGDGVTRQYFNGDFDLVGERVIAHN